MLFRSALHQDIGQQTFDERSWRIVVEYHDNVDWRQGCDEFGAIPREEFCINFRKIDVEYTKQNARGGPDGTVNFSDALNE